MGTQPLLQVFQCFDKDCSTVRAKYRRVCSAQQGPLTGAQLNGVHEHFRFTCKVVQMNKTYRSYCMLPHFLQGLICMKVFWGSGGPPCNKEKSASAQVMSVGGGFTTFSESKCSQHRRV